MHIFKEFINALFPNTCVSCGEVIPEGEFLCDYCFEFLMVTAKDRLCIKCGMPKRKCICKYRAYHFDGIAAPFYNSKVAKRAMYAFKFGRKEAFAKFFAERMALTVKQVYGDINFNFCCPVPIDVRSSLRRGYNQSNLLGEKLSEILGIPYYGNILSAHKKKKAQHDLPLKKRYENVKGIYYSNKKLNGKTILLVDDIKTTGATLDECAKVLLACGAERVYCITGIMTENKKGKQNANRNRN